MRELREKVARELDSADPGYTINLISLVDGVSEYSLTVGDEFHKFESHEDAREMGLELRRRAQADAVLKLVFDHLMEPSEAMMQAGEYDDGDPHGEWFGGSRLEVSWQAMLTKAKDEAGL